METEILLLEPGISIGKFKLMVWLAVTAFVVTYIAGRVINNNRGRTASVRKAAFISALFPLFLVWTGYGTHMDTFYRVTVPESGALTLDYVYPEGKQRQVIADYAAVKWQRGAQCSLTIDSEGERLVSAMTVNKDACRQAQKAIANQTKPPLSL